MLNESSFENIALKLSATQQQEFAKHKEAAKAINVFFINFLLKEMRKTIPENGFLKQNSGQKFAQSML
ncbi:hypothetical protein MHK_003730, partial [Candidatus Magnetomorum sp. HK-1]